MCMFIISRLSLVVRSAHMLFVHVFLLFVATQSLLLCTEVHPKLNVGGTP